MTAPTLTDFGPSITFAENTVNTTPQLLDSDVTFTDAEGNFDGGALSLTGLLAEDTASVRNEGTGVGQIGLSGSDVTYGGVIIGALVGGAAGSDLTITFNSAATSDSIDALIQNLTYANSSDAPTASRDLVLNVVDGAGEDLGLAPTSFTELTGAANPLSNLFLINDATPCFLDIDGDGDMDLISGGLFGRLWVYDNNDGDDGFTYQPGPNVAFYGVDLGSSTHPAAVDLDGDGDMDLVVGLETGGFRVYDNDDTGVGFTEIFGVTNPFNGIDVGTESAPTFVDLDGDGDMDMVVGNAGFDLKLYDNNDGDNGYTELTGAANPFASIGGTRSAPTFVDLDGDGDLDLVLGDVSGQLRVFDNDDGGPGFTQLTGAANPFDGIDLGFESAAAFTDLDGDGDMDLVWGANGNNLHVYENTTPRGVVITVTVTAENDATTFAGLPSDVAVNEATASDLDISALTLGDADANAGFTLTLTADSGVLNATSGAGVTITGSGTGALVLTGLASNIDAYLNNASAIQYTGEANVFGDGAASIILTSNDGLGDEVIGTVQVNITDVVETQIGDSGDNLLEGTIGSDILSGLDGNDTLDGGLGDDILDGGADFDTALFTGNDDIDVDLRIAGAQDTGHGSDTLSQIEALKTGSGNDKLIGTSESNHFESGNGKDVLIAGGGADTIVAGNGADILKGGNGKDVLLGGRGNDKIYGGRGNDKIEGGKGNDNLSGGDGSDDFIFKNGGGNDTITDFDATNNKEDIDLSAVSEILGFVDLSNNHMQQIGSDVVIDDGDGLSITLLDVDIADLGKGDFIF